MDEIIDVTKEVKNEVISRDTILAQRKGTNCLILKKCERRERMDGKWGTYILEYRWFNSPDTDVHSPRGNESTIWTRNEVKEVLSGKKNLFQNFQLF